MLSKLLIVKSALTDNVKFKKLKLNLKLNNL